MQPNPSALRLAYPAPALSLQEAEPAGPPGLPMPITRDQYDAMRVAAKSILHRLLLRVLWESGGRVSEVLRLRPCDLDRQEGALRLHNLKQRRRENRAKLVYTSRDLLAELDAFARSARVLWSTPYFRSRESGSKPMHRAQAHRIVTDCARRAGVYVPGKRGIPIPASPLNFRHGNAVDQLRAGVPLSEVQRQLGHSRIESTLVYLRICNAERRLIADRRFGSRA